MKRFLTTTFYIPGNDYLRHGAEVCQHDIRGVPSAPNGTTYNKAELSLPSHLLGDLEKGSILKLPGSLLKSSPFWETCERLKELMYVNVSNIVVKKVMVCPATTDHKQEAK